MIRIIAGRLKGRRVTGIPNDPGIRPISGRMRQSLFDILRPWTCASRFLDLFAGSGTVGLEALSRGAGEVVFVEMDPRCAGGIVKNLERFGEEGRARVLRSDVRAGLIRLKGEVFDIIFAGPPYKDAQRRPLRLASQTMADVMSAGILAPGGVMVAQHHKSDKPVVPDGLELWRSERYGDTEIDFYRMGV